MISVDLNKVTKVVFYSKKCCLYICRLYSFLKIESHCLLPIVEFIQTKLQLMFNDIHIEQSVANVKVVNTLDPRFQPLGYVIYFDKI